MFVCHWNSIDWFSVILREEPKLISLISLIFVRLSMIGNVSFASLWFYCFWTFVIAISVHCSSSNSEQIFVFGHRNTHACTFCFASIAMSEFKMEFFLVRPFHLWIFFVVSTCLRRCNARRRENDCRVCSIACCCISECHVRFDVVSVAVVTCANTSFYHRHTQKTLIKLHIVDKNDNEK